MTQNTHPPNGEAFATSSPQCHTARFQGEARQRAHNGERDRKNDGGLVSREEEKEGEEVGEEGSKAGDEMRQRLQAGIKPAIVRASAACTGTAAR